MISQQVEMKNGYIVSVNDIETTILRTILRPYANESSPDQFFCFVVDVEDLSEPNGLMKLWVSDELEKSKIERLSINSHIRFSAERDEDGDMIITKLRILPNA